MIILSNPIPEKVAGWDGLRLTNGRLSLGLVPQVGGRIMSLRYDGDEWFYVHHPENGKTYDFSATADIKELKKSFGFRLFGGDKTWVAPEKEWMFGIPPLELDAGPYNWRVDENQLVISSATCRETGLAITRKISFVDDASVHLEEELTNRSDKPVKRSVWNVSQILKPFDVLIPGEESRIRSYYHEDPSLPNPGIIMNPQVFNGVTYVAVRSEFDICFKCGGVPREGYVLTKKRFYDHEVIFERRFNIVQNPAAYAHRSAVEVYNSALFNYGEVEVHAPLTEILPGQSVKLQQVWSFRRL